MENQTSLQAEMSELDPLTAQQLTSARFGQNVLDPAELTRTLSVLEMPHGYNKTALEQVITVSTEGSGYAATVSVKSLGGAFDNNALADMLDGLGERATGSGLAEVLEDALATAEAQAGFLSRNPLALGAARGPLEGQLADFQSLHELRQSDTALAEQIDRALHEGGLLRRSWSADELEHQSLVAETYSGKVVVVMAAEHVSTVEGLVLPRNSEGELQHEGATVHQVHTTAAGSFDRALETLFAEHLTKETGYEYHAPGLYASDYALTRSAQQFGVPVSVLGAVYDAYRERAEAMAFYDEGNRFGLGAVDGQTSLLAFISRGTGPESPIVLKDGTLLDERVTDGSTAFRGLFIDNGGGSLAQHLGGGGVRDEFGTRAALHGGFVRQVGRALEHAVTSESRWRDFKPEFELPKGAPTQLSAGLLTAANRLGEDKVGEAALTGPAALMKLAEEGKTLGRLFSVGHPRKTLDGDHAVTVFSRFGPESMGELELRGRAPSYLVKQAEAVVALAEKSGVSLTTALEQVKTGLGKDRGQAL